MWQDAPSGRRGEARETSETRPGLTRERRARNPCFHDAPGREVRYTRGSMACRAALAIAVILAGAVRSGPALAATPPEQPASAVSASPPTAEPARGSSWFAFPLLFWLPETRLGFAAAGGLQFRLRGAERVSSLFVVGAYTLNHQVSADVASEVALPSRMLLTGRVRAVNFPDAFYGIGPFTPTSARESYTRQWVQGAFGAEFPLDSMGQLRFGPRLDLRAERITDAQPGGQIASGAVEGANGFTAVGLGGGVVWDTRDVPLFPHRGAFVGVWYLLYPEELGRHREFAAASVEGRWFRPAGHGRVLAAAAFLEQTFGNVPFTLLPKLGSSSYLRGWLDGRFRDQLACAAQVELRVPVWDRVGAVAFASTGEVARDLGALRADALRFAAGAGLRFRLTPEGANIRLDVAYGGSAGWQVYVLLLEAF